MSAVSLEVAATANGRRSVLVLGGDTRVILAIARSLGRRNVEVHVGWCRAGNPALTSRYVTRVHDLPPYREGHSDWKSALRRCLSAHRFDLVIPATEDTVHVLQTHRQEFEQLARIYLLNDTAFHVAGDKLRTYKLAAELEVPIPRMRVISDTRISENLVAELRLPVVLKPRTSLRCGAGFAKNFVRVVRTPSDLRTQLEEMCGARCSVLVQEYCAGVGVGLELLVDHGNIVFAFAHERLHETSGFGSTYRRSVQIDMRLLEAAGKLMEALDYTGVAMVEFRVDPATGRWVLLEINARFWGSLPLAVFAGGDFPWFLFQMLVAGKTAFEPDYRVGVRSRYLSYDTRWLWRTLRSASRAERKAHETRSGWEVNRVGWFQLLGEGVRMMTFRDHVDTFAWSDPQPCLAEMREIIRVVIANLRGQDE